MNVNIANPARPVILFLILLVVVLAVLITVVDPSSFTLESLPKIKLQLEGNLIVTSLIFVSVYAIGAVFLFPSALLTFAGGYIFNEYIGTILNLLGATIGGTLCFLLARKLTHFSIVRRVRDWQAKRLPNIRKKLSGFTHVFILRVTPVVPYSMLNYGFGLTKISAVEFALGTFLGLFPKVLIGTLLGAAGKDLGSAEFNIWSDYRIITALIIFGILILIGIIIEAQLQLKKKQSKTQ